MEGLLNIKRTELAELEKKLALEKEQLNLDVAKSIFADENAAFYKKLHAFFTTRVTEVEIASDFIVLYLEDGGESLLLAAMAAFTQLTKQPAPGNRRVPMAAFQDESNQVIVGHREPIHRLGPWGILQKFGQTA